MSLRATHLATSIVPRSRPATRRLGQLAFAVLLFALLVDISELRNWYVVNKGYYDSDWLTYFNAAQRLRDGGQPYVIADQFLNPPPFLLPLRLSLWLGYIPSRIIWSLASMAMLLGSAALTATAIGWRPSVRERLLGALYICLYTPTILLIPTSGNATAPVVLGYALALWLFARGREGWGGAALCLTVLIKPQLAFLTLPLLLYKRRWRAAVVYTAVTVATTALALFVTGWGTFVGFYHVERAMAGFADSAPLWIRDIPGLHAAFLQAWPHSAIAGAFAYVLGAGLVGALAWYWRGSWQQGMPRFVIGWALIPMVDLLVAPYAHSDDLVLLIIPAVVLYALQRVATDEAERRRHIAALLGLYLAPVLVVFFRQHFMVPAMLAALYVLWQATSATSQRG